MTVTKRDIVIRVSELTGLKQADVKEVLQKGLEHIVESLVRGENVELRNFGVFKAKTRRPRRGRNPKTGEEVPVPQRRVVSFRPGLEFKQKMSAAAS